MPHDTEADKSAARQAFGAFRLLRAVSAQGCQAVYRGEDAEGGAVAIRTVCLAAGPVAHRRLDNEYLALTRLAGAGPAPAVIATGRANGARYLVSTWLPGRTWRHQAHHVPDRDPWRLAVAAARALGDLHAAGVVHGDPNGNNILIGEDGTVRFVDFECSLIPDDPSPLRGVNRKITPSLAPPEFFLPQPGGGRALPTEASDQYSLAALLHRRLLGRPHQDAEPAQNPSPPQAGDAAMRSRADLALATALAPDPRDRYPTASAFAHTLHHALTTDPRPWRPCLPMHDRLLCPW
ncbi:phosphotransferase [Streptomyces sp. NPDC055107]